MSTIGLIVDVAVVVILLLLVIFGTWRGLYKLIFGLVSGLLSIVLAIVLVGTVTSFVVDKTELETTLGSAINETVLGAIPADLKAESVHVQFTEEGITVTNDETGDTYTSISEYVTASGNTSLSAVSSLLDSLMTGETIVNAYSTTDDDGNVTTSSPTLADLFCMTATIYLLLVIDFIVLWIVAFIVLRLLMMLLKKIVTRTYVGHFMNKALGFAIGAIIGMVFIWGVLAVIKLLGTYTWIIPVNNVINSSTLTKFLYDNNILYSFLVETMNLQDTISGIVGSFSGFGTTN